MIDVIGRTINECCVIWLEVGIGQIGSIRKRPKKKELKLYWLWQDRTLLFARLPKEGLDTC